MRFAKAGESTVVGKDVQIFSVGSRVLFKKAARLRATSGGAFFIEAGRKGYVKSVIPDFIISVGPEKDTVLVDIGVTSQLLEKIE